MLQALRSKPQPRLAATVTGIAVCAQVIETTIVTDKPPDPLPSLYPSF